MPTRLEELRDELNQKRDELHAIFEQHPDMKMKQETVEDIRKRNLELTDLGKQFEELREVEDIRQQTMARRQQDQKGVNGLPTPGSRKGGQPPQGGGTDARTLADLVFEHQKFQQRTGKHFSVDIPDVEVKTLLERTAGFAPEVTRTGKLVEYANRRPVVADLMPNSPTDQSAIKYMEETTFTNAADTVAEGAAKPESALAFTERSVPVEKIATWIPVTDEQLEDVDGMRSIIDNRLIFMVELTEEVQLLAGDGTPPDLYGFLTKPGVQTQAKGTDPGPDAIYKAMTKIRHTGFAEPSGAVFHPNDWQDIRLLRTADGIYIWGSPADPGPERIWGLPVVVTTAETENTSLVGDFRMFAEIRRKRGIMVEATNSHADYFIYNKQAIRAEERIALVIYRPAAFCKVTGM